MKLRSLSPNSYIHVSVRDLYIPTIGLLHILLQENKWTDHGNTLTLSLTAGGPIGQHFFECKMLLKC
jgi:hypothetical protein